MALVKTVRFNIITDPGEAKAKLDAISAKADELGRKNPEIKVRIDTAAAALKLKVLQHELKNTGTEADVASGRFDKLRMSVSKAADSMRKGGGPGWLGPALLSLPAVTTLAGVAGGAVLGLGLAFGTAAAAALAYGAVAKPVLSDALKAAQAVQTAQDNYNIAIRAGVKPAAAYRAEQIAIAKAYAQMTPAQIRLSQQLGVMSNRWQDFKASVTPLIAGSLQPWLRGITEGIGNLRSVIKPMALAVKDLGGQFAILMGSSTMQAFMRWIGTTGAAVTRSVGGAILNLLTAMTFLLPRFTPLIRGATDGITKWSVAFVRWSASQKAADQIRAFLKWFHDNGPLVGRLLLSMGGALKALAPGLGAGGQTELKLISGFLGLIAKLPPAVAKPLAEVAGALLLMNKLGVVKVGFQILGLAGTGAAEGAAAGGAATGLWAKALPGVRLVAGALIATVLIRWAGSKVPVKDLSRQAQADLKKAPPFAVQVTDLLHLTGVAGWIDQHFSQPARASIKGALGDLRQWIYDDFVLKLVRFFTSTLPLAFDIFRESIRITFDRMKIAALDAVLGITVAFGHLPGRLGAPFRAASASIRGELGKIQADVRSAADNINADWQKLHGKTVTLTFTLAGQGPVPGKTYPRGFAAGTAGAAPGWAWVGERGPELAYFRGGETVIPSHVARGYAAGTGPGFRDVFRPSTGVFGRRLGAAFSAAQAAVIAANRAAMLRKLLGALGGGITAGGGVGRWAGVAAEALAMLGQPSFDLGIVLRQIATESGGNPFAVNLTDSNAAAGVPSTGLLQVIGPTYAAYGAPRFGYPPPVANGVSMAPLANIFAGLNYAVHRYGPDVVGGQGWTEVLGHGHGYALGTSSAAPGWAWVGERGAELVRFRGGERVIPARGGGSGGPAQIVIQVQSSGHGKFDQFMIEWLRKAVWVRGGGNVQAAFGR